MRDIVGVTTRSVQNRMRPLSSKGSDFRFGRSGNMNCSQIDSLIRSPWPTIAGSPSRYAPKMRSRSISEQPYDHSEGRRRQKIEHYFFRSSPSRSHRFEQGCAENLIRPIRQMPHAAVRKIPIRLCRIFTVGRYHAHARVRDHADLRAIVEDGSPISRNAVRALKRWQRS